ncbi:glutamate racemase [Brevibacillus borstelensis]|uniref:glutamate racemase n=1 Tax=Brevibacillus borstelensis TaxID=45462 RepID=UPI0030C372B0
MSDHEFIAIIDSGVGGLTVAREVMRQLPGESILYFGDNARCPYGSRAPEEIQAFSFQMIEFVSKFPIKALVVACNTATAVVLEEAKKRLPLPVIGVIEPGARAAIGVTKTNRIGVIGTETTIRTKAYELAVKQLRPDSFAFGLACPAFVPLVETHRQHTEEAQKEVERTLAPLQGLDLDTLILGCTHYPLLAPLIQEAVGPKITLISSAEETASEVSRLLGGLTDGFSPGKALPLFPPRHCFYTSGNALSFQRIAEEWLGFPVEVESRPLEKLYQS